MLKHIYDYAVKNNLYKDIRYTDKWIRYHICIDTEGNVIGLEETSKQIKTICPTYPARKLVGNTSNFLVDKACVILDKENKKYKSFYNGIEEGSKTCPELLSIKKFLDKEHEEFEYVENITNKNLKTSSDLISFKVNSKYVEKLDSWKEYFEEKYKSLSEESDSTVDTEMISAITGRKINPLEKTDNVKVGGKTTSTGDIIICCDKEAYCSYGLKGATNGAISEEESKKIKFGLEHLLENNYSQNWNLIHWYDSDINTDILSVFLDNVLPADELINTGVDWDNESTQDHDKIIYDFIKNISVNGNISLQPSDLKDVNYYLLNYKPCGGRIAFSGFRIGNFNKLLSNLLLFYKDSEILIRYKTNDGKEWREDILPIVNIYSILYNLVSVDSKNKKDSVDKEFNIYIKQQLLNAIIEGRQIPYDFFKKAIMKIKKKKMSGETPRAVLYQILKVFINRDKRMKGEEETIMTSLNKDNKDIGYNLGRLLCVYGKIQNSANKVNTTVVDKYYASASTSPAYVFGRLATLSTYHLRKIENKGLVTYYKKLLQEVISNIDEIPKTLNIYEQANFSLGYYQQEQDFYTKKENINSEEDINNEE